MKIYTNTIDLANPAPKKIWVAPYSDFSIGVKFVVNNKPIDGDVILKTKDGVELTSNGKYGDGFTVFNMKSAEANETTEYIAIAPNGQENIIVQNVSDSTVYDVNVNADKTESIDLATPFTIELGETTTEATIWFSGSPDPDYGLYLEYRINDNEWTKYEVEFTPELIAPEITIGKGDKLQFRATDNGNSTFRGVVFNASIPVNSIDGLIFSGNIMTLLDNTGKRNDVPSSCFENWLGESTARTIYDAENLIFPAQTLSRACYAGMFYDCSKLIKAPKLPAMELAEQCYRAMFGMCTSLEYPMNELPAEYLPNDCYFQMFNGCSSLKTIPVIKAKEIVGGCCGMMFARCEQLTDLSKFKLYGDYNIDSTTNMKAYQGMFYQCINLIKSPVIMLKGTIMEGGYIVGNGTIHLMFAGCSSLEYIYMPFLSIGTIEEDGAIEGLSQLIKVYCDDGLIEVNVGE